MNMQRPWLKLFTALLAVHVAAVSKKKPTLRTPATFYPHKIKLDDLSVDLTANVVEKKLQEDGFLAV